MKINFKKQFITFVFLGLINRNEIATAQPRTQLSHVHYTLRLLSLSKTVCGSLCRGPQGFPGPRGPIGTVGGGCNNFALKQGLFDGTTGAILNGSGFSVTVNGAGDYTVHFTIPFAAAPIVMAIPDLLGSSVVLIATVKDMLPDSVHIFIKNTAGVLTAPDSVAFTATSCNS